MRRRFALRIGGPEVAPPRTVCALPGWSLRPTSVPQTKGDAMRKTSILTLAVAAVAALSVGAYTAFATSGAHFFSTSSSVNSSGALVVNWDEAGVGQDQVNYTLTADATALYACLNNGGQSERREQAVVRGLGERRRYVQPD